MNILLWKYQRRVWPLSKINVAISLLIIMISIQTSVAIKIRFAKLIRLVLVKYNSYGPSNRNYDVISTIFKDQR